MKVCNLASGSKGNCTYIASGKSAILIDQGLSVREFYKRAKLMDIDLDAIKGILVTHEHIDHIKGVEKLAQQLNIPIFINHQSAYKLCNDFVIETDEIMPFYCADFAIKTFRLPHDSRYNQGFRVTDGKTTMSIATDLGYASEHTTSMLSGVDLAIIESNHDMNMLSKGSYPQSLKQRIQSSQGHLSNDDCAELALKLTLSGAKSIMLAHLSQDNNTPELAFDCVCKLFQNNNICESKDVILEVANQFKPSRMILL